MRTAPDSTYLTLLQDYYARWRSLPSYARLGAVLGIASRSAVGKVLGRLRQQGFLDRTPDGIWVPAPRFFERPLAQAQVPAGDPATLDAGLDTLLIDDYLIDRPGQTLLVPVRGDSMTGAGIEDGDLVVVERTATAPEGAIVVALVDGALTVKRLRRDRDGYLLQPENPAYDVIRPRGALELVGVVTGLARRLRRGLA